MIFFNKQAYNGHVVSLHNTKYARRFCIFNQKIKRFSKFSYRFLLRRFLSLSVKEQNANFDAAVFERIKCGQSCDPIRFNKSKLGAAPPGSPGKGGAQLGVPPIYK